MKRLKSFKDRKTMGILLLSGATLLLLIVMMTIPQKKDEEDRPDTDALVEMLAEVPDAEGQPLPKSKREAYELTEGGMSNTDRYWENCEDLYEEKKEEEKAGERHASSGGGTGGNLFVQKDETQDEEDLYENPYLETQTERAERHRKTREEAITLAKEMGAVQEESVPEESGEEPQPLRILPGASSSQTTGKVTSLDAEWNVDNGISSLDDTGGSAVNDGMHPYRCMFAKDSRIKNGQRVAVILMEDLVAGGTVIPKHTHVMATCRLSDRLELEIPSIEMGGQILALGYEAWDLDGSRGIYCPDTGNTRKQARSSGRNIVSSRLTGLMGGLARDVVNTGVSLMQSRDGESTVTVPAGYTFFLLKKNLNTTRQ